MTTTTNVAPALPIAFGTDGWRAIIAEDFTFENVRFCAQALCTYMAEQGRGGHGLVVGYDTRFASPDFAAATAEVIAGNGFKVFLCDKTCPTPVVSHTIRHLGADGGVVITASHNPGEYNGFKIKTNEASSAPQEMVDRIESYLPALARSRTVKQLPLADAIKQGLVSYVDPVPPYFETVRKLLTPERLERIKNAELSIIVDSMYGAGMGYFRRILVGGKTKVREMNAVRNPAFPGIQPEPIARNLHKLETQVRRSGSVGLATDGDADRLGVVDEQGNFVTQLQVYALLALYLLEVREQRGPLIKTITTSSMIERLGERYHVPVIETDVGFKYVGPEMIKRDALMGGEESGGYGFRGHIPERDGIVAGLYFLDLMVATGKTPSQLIVHLYSITGPHYYDRRDLHFPPERRQQIIAGVANPTTPFAGSKMVKQERFGGDNGAPLNGVRYHYADNSWLLVRFSGTEPVLRIYAETSTPEGVVKMLDWGVGLTGLK